METTVIDTLIKLGSTGILAGVLWLIAKRFMDETVQQMSARIAALEIATQECEADRRTLHSQIVDILTERKHQHESPRS